MDTNPNVFLELGIRQSFKPGKVTIAEIGTIIPFDIVKKYDILSPTKPLEIQKLQKAITESSKRF